MTRFFPVKIGKKRKKIRHGHVCVTFSGGTRHKRATHRILSCNSHPSDSDGGEITLMFTSSGGHHLCFHALANSYKRSATTQRTTTNACHANHTITCETCGGMWITAQEGGITTTLFRQELNVPKSLFNKKNDGLKNTQCLARFYNDGARIGRSSSRPNTFRTAPNMQQTWKATRWTGAAASRRPCS